MTKAYSVETCKKLEVQFQDAALHRPMRVGRYDAGTEIVYDVTDVAGTNKANIRVIVEQFVGGGFAGQVYRVKVVEISAQNGPIEGLAAGGIYAMKILIPPSGFARLFRNVLYGIGFQGPFQLQVNPAAARAGALWQKIIRRGAKIRFGDEKAVVDIFATFVDHTLGSCGELSEWIDGRNWRLEVDDHLDYLKHWRRGRPVDTGRLGSPEYRAKYEFMHEFVKLLHDMGAYEFARQYEWYTCKSQPNCLKRKESGNDPSAGLVAVDFRAGLALLPFLPMSPADFKLIVQGLGRGSLVQFDRGSISKLERFVEAHGDDFTDMHKMLDALKIAERDYRDSLPDITHNHFRLLYSRQLWSTIIDSAVNGWKVQNIIDETGAQKLSSSKFLALWFYIIALIPWVGTFLVRFWGQANWRNHYLTILKSWKYLKRAFQGRIVEKVIVWHRSGRVDSSRAQGLTQSGLAFMIHLPLSILPVGLHRSLTDWSYAKERLIYLFVRPVRLYFNSELREQWLHEMITEGQQKQILSAEDAGIILSQIKEPFIQKYLKSLAVHVCTLPVTQIVSVAVAMIYVAMHPEMPRAQAWGIGIGIIALFQVTPISPGSLVRGFYVLYLVISERNFKDYNIAVFLGFFKYIGYLAFPIQMTYRYPVLARFMAGHWARETVHIVPVFGESGALLEHWVYGLFYNWPLTIRRRIRNRIQLRKDMDKRLGHMVLIAIAAAAVLGIADFLYLQHYGKLPGLKTIWWLAVLLPSAGGVLATLGAGGASLGQRFVGAAACGVAIGLLYTALSALVVQSSEIAIGTLGTSCMWRVFLFSMLSTLGAIFTELILPDPDLN